MGWKTLVIGTILLQGLLCISATNEHEVIEAHQPTTHRNIEIVDDDFVLDGKKVKLLSGSFHYFRSPAAYWRDRLRKMKAAGLNAVATYVEWSFHETEERVYNFEGDRDIVSFINIAAQEGLLVLLRPGPYICAERDLGGFPYWLIGKYPNIRLRTLDKDFMSETTIWFDKLFEYIKPLLFGNGGPIVLVQVENEYGSYGDDKRYMGALRDIIRNHVGCHALLYTTDGPDPSLFKSGSVNGTLTTIDFGTGENVAKSFAGLREFMPKGPLMNSEFYPGWLTHWTEPLQRISSEEVVKTLRQMLNQSININFYVFYGGSNFEFTSGANFFVKYQPDITSYDYDAPLTEAGDPTEKFAAIKSVIGEYYPKVRRYEMPQASPKGAYGEVTVAPKVKLLSTEGRQAYGKDYPTSTNVLPTFEKLRQRNGFLLFETNVSASADDSTQLLKIKKPRDQVYVFLNGKLQGVFSRMYKISSLPLEIKNNTVLSLLVENQGRINFGPKLFDPKGILSPVILDGKHLKGPWTTTGFPLEMMDVPLSESHHGQQIQSGLCGPVLYEGSLTLPPGEQPLETFLDPAGWGKGFIWINGYNLGRYWKVGPQRTLYVPGVWLKPAPAQNHIQVLELEESPCDLKLTFLNYPLLG